MKLNMRYWIITILSFLSFLAEAQKPNMLLAEKLLEKEYEFFVSVSDSEKVMLLMDKAHLYTVDGEYDHALFELERAQKISASDDIRLQYEIMLNYFLSSRFNQSASMILPADDLVRIGRNQEYITMRLVSLNENRQWEACRSELLKACLGCDSTAQKGITDLRVLFNYTDPIKCQRLSQVVPGLGMVRAGKPRKGATSFLIQAGITLFTGYAFYTGYYVAGVVSGIFPLMKFHMGGGRLSATLAEEKNEKEREKLKTLYRLQIKKVVHR